MLEEHISWQLLKYEENSLCYKCHSYDAAVLNLVGPESTVVECDAELAEVEGGVGLQNSHDLADYVVITRPENGMFAHMPDRDTLSFSLGYVLKHVHLKSQDLERFLDMKRKKIFDPLRHGLVHVSKAKL